MHLTDLCSTDDSSKGIPTDSAGQTEPPSKAQATQPQARPARSASADRRRTASTVTNAHRAAADRRWRPCTALSGWRRNLLALPLPNGRRQPSAAVTVRWWT